MTPPLTTTARLLAWFAILAGLATAATPLMAEPGDATSPLLCLMLGMLSLVAGGYGLGGRPWAFGLLSATYLVQVMEYQSEHLTLSLMGPVALHVAFVWQSPPSRYSLNLVALIVCLLAARSAVTLGRRPTALPPEPPPT